MDPLEQLAKQLMAENKDGLYNLVIERCLDGTYDDFKTTIACPKMQMVDDLRLVNRNDIATDVMKGKYDQ